MQISLRDQTIEIRLSPTTAYREKSLRSRGARFKKKDQVYTLPLLATHLDWLNKFYRDATWSEDLRELVELDFTFPFINRGQDDHPRWQDLYPFQKETVDFLTSTPRPGALVALSPRLGKTITSLVSVDILRLRDVLVVTTPTLFPDWSGAVKEWIGRDVQTCWGSDPDEDGESFVITTYETIFKTIPGEKPTDRKTVVLRDSLERHWDIIIFDESIGLKNRDAYRTEAAIQLRKYADRVWLLSGSPTSMYLDDLYSQLEIICPRGFTSYWRFCEENCLIEESVWSRSVVGDRPDVDPQTKYRDLLFVRAYHEVVNLPGVDQRTELIQMYPDQAKAYKELLKDFSTTIRDRTISAQSRLAQRIRLQQIVSAVDGSSAKVDRVVELLQSSEVVSPVLCWVHWQETGDLLERRLREVFSTQVRRVSGGDFERDQKIADYKNGVASILVCSLGVGKFGLDLSNTRTVIYVDKSDRADDWIQSFFRVIHLKSDHVVKMIHLVTPKSTDELIAANLAGKGESISRITDIDLVLLLKSLAGVS